MFNSVRVGAVAGLVGGIVFGMMMAMMGMLTVIAGMVGSSSAIVGFMVHLVISAMIGAGYGVVLGSLATSTTRGLACGGAYVMAWWVLGPLPVMPPLMGMGFVSKWTS